MKRSTVQVLSFISGLTVAAVVIGVTICKSTSLRNEIEGQVKSVLKTTRSVVDAYKSFGSTSKNAVNLIKNEPSEKTAREESAAAEKEAQINSQWDTAEASDS